MDRKPSDVYIGAALVALLVCLVGYFFRPTILLYLLAIAGWITVALKLWATEVLFARIISTLMFFPVLLLLFVRPAIQQKFHQDTGI